MNENRLEIIKALTIRGANLRMAKECICNTTSLMLHDAVRDRLKEMYDELYEMIKKNDESVRFWSTDDTEEEE